MSVESQEKIDSFVETIITVARREFPEMSSVEIACSLICTANTVGVKLDSMQDYIGFAEFFSGASCIYSSELLKIIKNTRQRSQLINKCVNPDLPI